MHVYNKKLIFKYSRLQNLLSYYETEKKDWFAEIFVLIKICELEDSEELRYEDNYYHILQIRKFLFKSKIIRNPVDE